MRGWDDMETQLSTLGIEKTTLQGEYDKLYPRASKTLRLSYYNMKMIIFTKI